MLNFRRKLLKDQTSIKPIIDRAGSLKSDKHADLPEKASGMPNATTPGNSKFYPLIEEIYRLFFPSNGNDIFGFNNAK